MPRTRRATRKGADPRTTTDGRRNPAGSGASSDRRKRDGWESQRTQRQEERQARRSERQEKRQEERTTRVSQRQAGKTARTEAKAAGGAYTAESQAAKWAGISQLAAIGAQTGMQIGELVATGGASGVAGSLGESIGGAFEDLAGGLGGEGEPPAEDKSIGDKIMDFISDNPVVAAGLGLLTVWAASKAFGKSKAA